MEILSARRNQFSLLILNEVAIETVLAREYATWRFVIRLRSIFLFALYILNVKGLKAFGCARHLNFVCKFIPPGVCQDLQGWKISCCGLNVSFFKMKILKALNALNLHCCENAVFIYDYAIVAPTFVPNDINSVFVHSA